MTIVKFVANKSSDNRNRRRDTPTTAARVEISKMELNLHKVVDLVYGIE